MLVSDLVKPERNLLLRSTVTRTARASKKVFISVLSSIVFFASLLTAILRMKMTAAVIILPLLVLPLFGAVLIETVPAHSSPAGERLVHTLANNPPYFAQNLPLYIYPTTDTSFEMAIGVADVNDDTVNVTWEWGDDSPNALNTTPPALTPAWVNQTHTWSIPREPGVGDYYAGPFLVNITLDDGMGGVTHTQRSAYVYVPPNGVPEMSLSAPAKVDPSDAALIVANASDPEGDPMTWTLVLNDSVTDFYTEVFHTPATAPNETVWNNITYVFGVEGSYTIMMNVSDALPPNQVWPHNISFSVSIQVIINHAPQVVGVIDTDPESLLINATIGVLVVDYTVEAFDPDGDVLTANWDFGDGTPTATNVSAGGTQVYEFVQQRNYTDTGEYNISVVIGDGRPGHNVSLYRVVQITSTNLPPSVVSFGFHYSSERSYGLPNESIVFELVIGDPESNNIEVVVSFGDNSTVEYYNLTQFVERNATLTLNHSYASPGEYLITVWYTDNKTGLFEHAKYYNVTVTVKELSPIIHNYWTTWDYISLSLFACAFILPILWAIIGMLQRKRRDMEVTVMPEESKPFAEKSLDDLAKEPRRRG
jgi:hypothetical protein